jgi:hypothetical protein
VLRRADQDALTAPGAGLVWTRPLRWASLRPGGLRAAQPERPIAAARPSCRHRETSRGEVRRAPLNLGRRHSECDRRTAASVKHSNSPPRASSSPSASPRKHGLNESSPIAAGPEPQLAKQDRAEADAWLRCLRSAPRTAAEREAMCEARDGGISLTAGSSTRS